MKVTMQRRRFNTLALGAAVLSSGLSACGGGSDAPSGPLELALPDFANGIALPTSASSEGSYLTQWAGNDTSSWQRYSADGKKMGAVVGVPLSGSAVAVLNDGSVVIAREEDTHLGEGNVLRVHRIRGYAADGVERFATTLETDRYTSLLAVLPSGDFLMTSANVISSINGEPALPTPYDQTQVQRYNRSGVAVGVPIRIPGERGHRFSVAPRAQGGYWLLRTEIKSFGYKGTQPPAQNSRIVLDRYDDNDRLQASTVVAVATDTLLAGSRFTTGIPSLYGLRVAARPDGGATVQWMAGVVYYGPTPEWRQYFRTFDAAAQPIGSEQLLWPNLEIASASEVLTPEPRSDGSLDVFVVRHEGANQRWWLRTLDGRSGTWTGDARLVLERTSSASTFGAWKTPIRLRDGAAVVFLPVEEALPGGGVTRRYLMRKLGANGNWQAWAE